MTVVDDRAEQRAALAGRIAAVIADGTPCGVDLARAHTALTLLESEGRLSDPARQCVHGIRVRNMTHAHAVACTAAS
jgi:hypothetical protein